MWLPIFPKEFSSFGKKRQVEIRSPTGAAARFFCASEVEDFGVIETHVASNQRQGISCSRGHLRREEMLDPPP